MLIVKDFGRDLRVHFYDGQTCLCSEDNFAYSLDLKTGRVSKLFQLPSRQKGLFSSVKNFLARSWVRRKFVPNSSFDNVIALSHGGVFVVYDRVYYFNPHFSNDKVEVLDCCVDPPFAPPLRGGVAEHLKSGRVYFGEYVNDRRERVRVFRVNLRSKTVESCWAFGRNQIKHIHAVHYDRFRDRLWILTGDLDHECAFYYTDDEFESVHLFAGGDQTWRAIALLFDEDGMEWGTDAGKDAAVGTVNKIFRYDFLSGRRSELAVIDNPVYGAHEFNDGTALMQTGYEGGSHGKGDQHASLWYRGRNRVWRMIFKLPFHLNPRQGEGEYAQILIPKGVGSSGGIFCTPVNTGRYNYKLLELTDYE